MGGTESGVQAPPVDRKYAACSRITASMFIKALNELVCPWWSHLYPEKYASALAKYASTSPVPSRSKPRCSAVSSLVAATKSASDASAGARGASAASANAPESNARREDVEDVGSGTTRVSFEARTETARRDVEAARRARGARVEVRAAAMDVWVTANMCEYLVDVRAGGGRRR